MKVCIIGNSPNLLENDLGEKIDSFDQVIRINDFLIKGFEKQIGSKTTVVAAGFSSASIMLSGNYETSYCMDTCDIWVLHPDAGRIARAKEYGGGIPDNRLFVIDNRSYSFLVREIYKDFWRPVPSCGIATIQMALEIFKGSEIFILGFDSNTGVEGKGHYYEEDFLDKDMPGDPVGHDWNAENLYIQKLVSESKIKRLS